VNQLEFVFLLTVVLGHTYIAYRMNQ